MKNKIVFIGTVMLLFLVLIGSVLPANIVLKQGSNLITIKIFNNSKMDIKSIQVFTDSKKLTKGILITKEVSQKLDVPTEMKSELGIEINIIVSENVKPGSYKIPLILKDKDKHSWNYTIEATVIENIITEYNISQNYPNPFNPITKIEYSLANKEAQQTELIIYNISGQKVRTLINERQSSGAYNTIWDGKDDKGNSVTSGIYIYKISSGLFKEAKKMLYLK